MELADKVLSRFDKFPDDEPPHNALYRYDRRNRCIRRVNSLWLWVRDDESIGIVTHPDSVKSTIQGRWEQVGDGREKEWWTHDDAHGLVLLPVNPDVKEARA